LWIKEIHTIFILQKCGLKFLQGGPVGGIGEKPKAVFQTGG
jgi:hypothetical protein